MRPSTYQYVFIPTMWHKSAWGRRLISTYIYKQCDTNLHEAVDSSVRILPTMWHKSAWGRRLISTYIYQQCDTNLHEAVDSSVHIYTNKVTQICMRPSTHQYVYIPTMCETHCSTTYQLVKIEMKYQSLKYIKMRKKSIYTWNVFHSMICRKYNYIK